MINPLDASAGNTGLFTGEHLFFISTTLLMSLGLFFVAFASEKIEDEQIRHLRLDSLRWAIYINYLILIISLVFVNDTAHILELNLWVPLFFFIIRFRWVIFLLNRSINREG
jgi:cell division protein FtsW (lipid II flippase)